MYLIVFVVPAAVNVCCLCFIVVVIVFDVTATDFVVVVVSLAAYVVSVGSSC